MKVVYRKMQNGKEFMKIMEGNMYALSVIVAGLTNQIAFGRIHFTENKIVIADYLDDHVSMPSTEAEFETAYKEVAKKFKQFFEVKQ